MEKLKQKILKEGIAVNETVLKVDSFLNHGVDPDLIHEIGIEFKKYFQHKGITKIFTIESSGIAPAVMCAMEMNLPMVIFKKQTSKILDGQVYQEKVHSFTKGADYQLTLSKKFINKEDRILIIDDFLANGEAALGAARLVEEAQATVAGIGIVIEKSFQPGRKKLLEKNYDVYSLARIKKLGENLLEFIEE